jgi:hypothetical protein
MSISLITFIASGCGIIAFLCLKVIQQRRGVLLFWPRFRSRIELRLRKIQDKIVYSQGIGVKTVYSLTHLLLRKTRSLLTVLEQKIDRKSKNLLSQIRGKQVLENRGRASHFLHDITHFRDRFKK